METPGAYLKRERDLRGVSLEEVSKATHVPLRMLEFLEADNFEALPEIPFVKGYIQSYSKHIGLDPRDALLCLEAYLQELKNEEAREESSEEKPSYLEEKTKRENFSESQDLIIKVLAIFGVVVMLVYFVMPRGDDVDLPVIAEKHDYLSPDSPESPDSNGAPVIEDTLVTFTATAKDVAITTTTTAVPATAPTAITVAKPKPKKKKPKVVQKKYRLELRATGDVTVKVEVDFGEVLEIVLKKGEKKSFGGDKGFKIFLGDAGLVNVTYNDSDLGLLGDVGEEFSISLPMN